MGVYDTDGARRDSVATQFGVTAFPNLESLIEAVDAVNIAVPTTAHHATALKCLEGGAHVFIEKPIASTAAEASDIVRIARDRGLTVQVGHIERFNPAIRASPSSPFLPH